MWVATGQKWQPACFSASASNSEPPTAPGGAAVPMLPPGQAHARKFLGPEGMETGLPIRVMPRARISSRCRSLGWCRLPSCQIRRGQQVVMQAARNLSIGKRWCNQGSAKRCSPHDRPVRRSMICLNPAQGRPNESDWRAGNKRVWRTQKRRLRG